jgi:hypothetical protein
MSDTNGDQQQEPLKLGELDGAVLAYEDSNGDTVKVEFDE